MNRKQEKGKEGVKNEEITGQIKIASRCNDKTEEKRRRENNWQRRYNKEWEEN